MLIESNIPRTVGIDLRVDPLIFALYDPSIPLGVWASLFLFRETFIDFIIKKSPVGGVCRDKRSSGHNNDLSPLTQSSDLRIAVLMYMVVAATFSLWGIGISLSYFSVPYTGLCPKSLDICSAALRTSSAAVKKSSLDVRRNIPITPSAYRGSP